MTATRRPPPWALYAVVGAAAVGLGQALPHLPGVSAWPYYTGVYLAVNASSVGALAAGLARYRPPTPAWRFILANQVVYLAADAVFYLGRNAGGWRAFPQPADALYLAHYPLLVAGVLVMIRAGQGRRDIDKLADSLIAGIGFAVLSWVLLIAPNVHAHTALLAKVTSVAYPLADLVTFLIAIRLLVGAGLANASMRLLLGGLVVLFATDSVYCWMQLNGSYSGNRFLDVLWQAYYLLLGASALHPGMARALAPAARRRPRPVRYVVLGTLALVTPVAGLVDAYTGRPGTATAVDWGSLVLFVVVAARMLRLMARQRALAHRLSGALDRAREAEADRARLLSGAVDAAEQERMRLAIDLHDGPLQRLASAGYALDGVARRLGRGQVEQAAGALGRIRDGLAGEVTVLRRMMAELRPPVLDEGGLVPALHDYLAAYRARTGIRACLDAGLGARLTAVAGGPDLETVLYRVVQEALLNVERHACATRVQVTLRDVRHGVRLTVEDDGTGFDAGAAARFVREGHFGLAGMRERIRAVHGGWRVVSYPGRGTRVEATVPAPAARSAPALAGARSA